jgi:hypothetical protein
MKRVFEFEDNECPTDKYKLCGPDKEGKEEYQMCVPFEYDCPIISLKQSIPEDQKWLEKGFTEINLNKELSLYYSSNDDDGGMPISEFILSEGDASKDSVCINKEDFIVPPNKEIYPLLNTNFYKG